MLCIKNIIIIIGILLIYLYLLKPVQENFNKWEKGVGIGGTHEKIDEISIISDEDEEEEIDETNEMYKINEIDEINKLSYEDDYENKCINLVLGKRPDANGATIDIKGNIRNCYAEFGMQSRNNNKNFKSIMIKEDIEPYNKISKSYPSAEKLNRTPCEYWAAKRRCSRDPIFMNKYCQKSCAKRKSCIDNLESRKCDYLVDCSRRLNPMFNKTYCQNYEIDTK